MPLPSPVAALPDLDQLILGARTRSAELVAGARASLGAAPQQGALGDLASGRELAPGSFAAKLAAWGAPNPLAPMAMGTPVAPGTAGTAETAGAAGDTGDTGDTGTAGNPLQALVDRVEGGGGYDTLFGYAQKPGGKDGGRFDGVDVSRMTLDQLYDFTDPQGAYGQWVKGQVGHVATPLGRNQIVGTTLKRVASAMGLPGSTVFSKSVQDSMFDHLARQRLASASSMSGRMAALRNEWDGFNHVPDSDLASAISAYMRA